MTPTPTLLSEQYDREMPSPRAPMQNSAAHSYDENSYSLQSMIPNTSRNSLTPNSTPILAPKANEMNSRSPRVNMPPNSSRNTSGIPSTPKSIPKQQPDETSRSTRPSMHKSTRNTITSLPAPPSPSKQQDESSRASRPSIHNSLRHSQPTTPIPTVVPQQYIEGSCILNSCAFL
ncbi:unnamed protein product [Adineta ricciae]|nr:unnamed protein product [Adineta ricciae]